MPDPYPLPLLPALILTATLLLLTHWFPLTRSDRLHRLGAYAVGVLCVGIPLVWHQYTQGALWWHYPLFFSVGGSAVALAYAADKLLTKTTTDAIADYLGVTADAQSQGGE